MEENELPSELKLEIDKNENSIKELNVKFGRMMIDQTEIFIKLNKQLKEA